MLQYCQGDRTAADRLIRTNFARVRAYLYRITGRSPAAEDLTQDVFTRMIESARDYRPTAKFSTWLYRIATNAALNHLRGKRMRGFGPVPTANDPALADEHEAEPPLELERDEVRAALVGAIDRLRPNQRVAFTLYYSESLSYESIAAVMEVTVEAVRSLLARARAALRQELDGIK